MSRRLDDLADVFRPTVFELLARLIEADIPHKIIFTGRTQAEQDEAVRTGHSKVQHSKHQDGLAIDLCPWDQYLIHGEDKLAWSTDDPATVVVWKRMGAIGKALGMRWGGDFPPLNKLGLGWDAGHFEYVAPTVAKPPQRV